MRPKRYTRLTIGGTARFLRLAAVLFGLVLAGCSANNAPAAAPVDPIVTLSPTLSPASTTPEVAAVTPTPEGQGAVAFAPQEEQTPSPEPTSDGTITPTITPWPNDTPTAGPSPTPSRTPTRTRVPTRTRAPTQTVTITETPTVTFTPTPPPPDQLILRPGLMSRLISPIQMEIYAVTGDDGFVTVELIGEDTRVIAQQLLDYKRGRRNIYSIPLLPFEIDAISEMSRLQVWSKDEFGRIIALSSVDVVLLTVGRNEITPPLVTLEPYIIDFPPRNAIIKDGLLRIDGKARPVNESPMILELIDEAGQVFLSEQFTVDPPGPYQTHSPFHLELEYDVEASTAFRLVIRQEGSRIPGTVALTSRLLSLEP